MKKFLSVAIANLLMLSITFGQNQITPIAKKAQTAVSKKVNVAKQKALQSKVKGAEAKVAKAKANVNKAGKKYGVKKHIIK